MTREIHGLGSAQVRFQGLGLHCEVGGILLCGYFCCSTIKEDLLEMAWSSPRTPDCQLRYMEKSLGEWQGYHKLLGLLKCKASGLWGYLICAGCILHGDTL